MSSDKVSVIVPIFNSIRHLKVCLDSIVAAIRHYGNAELILVDNGSRDGSYEMLCSDYALVGKIYQLRGATISAVRNYGAEVAQGDYLSFIDSDCVIPKTYFHRAMAVFASIDCDAAGCYVDLPGSPHWIEETWQGLHWRVKDGYVPYLLAANLVVKRALFREIGGFDENLITGEDAELGLRLTAAGFKMYESHDISAIHLGNPKSLRAFFRKNIWHGLGMFGSLKSSWFDKPLLMTFAHLFLTTIGVANLFLSTTSFETRFAVLALSSAFAPTVTVIYRYAQRGKIYRPVRSILLYYLYFTARLCALLKLVFLRVGRDRLRREKLRSV